MLDRFLEPSGRTFDEWADGPVNHNFPKPRWRKYEEQGFATRSGKVELVPTLLAELGVDPSPRYTGPPYAAPDAPAAEFPLQMIPGSRYRELTASNLRQSARLKKIHPEPICDIHPETAAVHGIVDGDWVVIERPEGAITQRARVHDGIRPDTIHPDGYWWEPSVRARARALGGLGRERERDHPVRPGALELRRRPASARRALPHPARRQGTRARLAIRCTSGSSST